MKKRRKLKYKRIILCLIILLLIPLVIIFYPKKDPHHYMLNLTNSTLQEIEKYAKENDLKLTINYEYDDTIAKNKLISQSISEKTIINPHDQLVVVISLGQIDLTKLKTDGINELGKVPIMMYHGIENMKNDETKYTGGNIDKDGYNRTAEAFTNDLTFYYEKGYEMIRLIDYVEGNIDTSYGKSPIVLTFDDGNANNLKVTGLDSKGNILIDPNSAVGILESFKQKHPDYHVTATFFVNDALFNQPEYNEKILKWLVNNGYDIGNHTKGHVDFKKINMEQTQTTVGYVYNQLNSLIPNQYQNIIALPFGSPYTKSHSNFAYILNGTYNNQEYHTKAALRVGWEADYSPYAKAFDPTFIKRCRAYDNLGKDFDIEMNFRLLETKKYISDGNLDTIVTAKTNEEEINKTNKKIILY